MSVIRASLSGHPNVEQWLALDTEGSVTVRTGKVDIGQHIGTALALIVADELDVDPSRIEMATPDTNTAPDEGFTSGSNSMEESGQALRLSAATARRFLLARAAEHLKCEVHELDVTDGLVASRTSNESVTYWELLPAGQFSLPVDINIVCKPAAEHRLIGRTQPARRMAQLVSGTLTFVQDMHHQGDQEPLHARVVRPPHYHSQLQSLDGAVMSRFPGCQLVRDGSFVAVAGPDEFVVGLALEAVATAALWKTLQPLDERDVFSQLPTNQRLSLPVIDGVPQKTPMPAASDPSTTDLPRPGIAGSFSATYERPYQMHASLGASAAMAEFTDGHMTVWTHTQGIFPLRQSIADTLGLATENVRLIHQPGPGCYGHNGSDDAALDAALVAREFPGKAVLLKWTRDDEHAWEPYSSCMQMSLQASVAAAGTITDWSHETFSDTHLARPRPGGSGVGPSRLLSARYLASPHPAQLAQPSMAAHGGIHRNADPLYSFERRRIVKHLVRDMPLRVSAMRTLGAYANVFAGESFIDELALHTGADPVEFRLHHMTNERARDVITTCAQRANWGTELPIGHGRGFGFAQYKNVKAYAAVAVEVSLSEAGDVRLHHATIAADAGQIIDREGLALQLEGGFLQAASWTLHEAVTYDRDGITSRDWDTYPVLRFDNIPTIDIALIERPDEPPLGAGEATGGPTGAAIANAIFNASGLRLRRLPFTRDAVRAAASAS
jgi:nicotinate dehydrogenase subunit B